MLQQDPQPAQAAAMKWMETPRAHSGTHTALRPCFSRIDPVLSCVLPASQLLWAEPEGDLLSGTLNRVTAMDHIPVGKKRGISSKQRNVRVGSCNLESFIFTDLIKLIEPVTSYDILPHRAAPLLPTQGLFVVTLNMA